MLSWPHQPSWSAAWLVKVTLLHVCQQNPWILNCAERVCSFPFITGSMSTVCSTCLLILPALLQVPRMRGNHWGHPLSCSSCQTGRCPGGPCACLTHQPSCPLRLRCTPPRQPCFPLRHAPSPDAIVCLVSGPASVHSFSAELVLLRKLFRLFRISTVFACQVSFHKDASNPC